MQRISLNISSALSPNDIIVNLSLELVTKLGLNQVLLQVLGLDLVSREVTKFVSKSSTTQVRKTPQVLYSPRPDGSNWNYIW